MKRFLVFFIMMIAFVGIAFGQDSETVQSNPVLDWITANWVEGAGLAAILTSFLVRWIPTEKANLAVDVIGWLLKLAEKVIPNRKKGGGTH